MSATMQALAERESYSGHLVLTDELVEEAGGAALQEVDQYGAATAYQPFRQPEGWPRPLERRSQHDETLQEARETHQQVLEAAHQLELDIKRLNQEVGNVQCQHPCSCSDSHWWSKSLDRLERSLSRCRPERHVTFCKPEVEPFLGRGPYWEPKGLLPIA